MEDLKVTWRRRRGGIRYSGVAWEAALAPLPALNRADWPEEPDTVLYLEVERLDDPEQTAGADLELVNAEQCLWYVTISEDQAGFGDPTMERASPPTKPKPRPPASEPQWPGRSRTDGPRPMCAPTATSALSDVESPG